MFGFQYPAVFTPAEEGGFIVSFPQFDEIVTQGDDLNDALEQAEDALEEAIANRIAMNCITPSERLVYPRCSWRRPWEWMKRKYGAC
jgi:predicted RNase H-like HicB family nuclease